MTKTSKNFGLTELEFTSMLEAMKSGDEAMFEHIFLSHFKTNIRYLRAQYKLSYENAYDLCMETMVFFREKLLADKIHYGNLDFLFNQMSRQLYLQGLRKEASRDKARALWAPIDWDNNVEKQQLLDLLDRAWEALGDHCRLILQSFYFDRQRITAIAEQLQKSDAALRKQKQRCVTQLKMQMKRFMQI